MILQSIEAGNLKDSHVVIRQAKALPDSRALSGRSSIFRNVDAVINHFNAAWTDPLEVAQSPADALAHANDPVALPQQAAVRDHPFDATMVGIVASVFGEHDS